MEAMGATAVQIVVDSIRAAVERREGNAVVHRKVAPELVVRESTRQLP
jgi:DNA-binding LacI/PurR family transcriptional regulator